MGEGEGGDFRENEREGGDERERGILLYLAIF